MFLNLKVVYNFPIRNIIALVLIFVFLLRLFKRNSLRTSITFSILGKSRTCLKKMNWNKYLALFGPWRKNLELLRETEMECFSISLQGGGLF